MIVTAALFVRGEPLYSLPRNFTFRFPIAHIHSAATASKGRNVRGLNFEFRTGFNPEEFVRLIDAQLLTLVSLTVLLIIHDTLPLGRWNNVGRSSPSAGRNLGGTFVNAAVGIVPLYIAWVNRHAQMASSGQFVITIILAVVLTGAAISWWIPWLFGSSQSWQAKLRTISADTLTVIPCRHGVNVNALHCLIHLLTIIALSESLYMLRR